MGQESLQGKLAVITGASSGIGRAVAVALFERGARLLLLGRDEARLLEVAGEVGDAMIRAFDLGDDEALGLFAATMQAEGVQPDILVHSAGVVALGQVADAPLDDLDRQYRVNLRAPYALTQKLLPGLRARRGQVVFVNSGAGHTARANWSGYAASKHGLKALADSLRSEESALRVISVYPGRTASPMQEEVRRQEGAPYNAAEFIQPADIAELVACTLALPRTAAVSDVSVRPG